jgi:hypothetical protein
VDGSSIKPSITFLLPPEQHKPKQLNQVSNTELLMRMETLLICFIPNQGTWVDNSALLIPFLSHNAYGRLRDVA